MKTLPDHLRKGMKLVIVGCNPTESSVRTGHYYSGRENPFWPILYETGVIPEPLEYRDDKRIIEFAIGLTDLVKRPTRTIEELTREDYAEGRIVLSQKLGDFVPRVIAFNGKNVTNSCSAEQAGPAKAASIRGERLCVAGNRCAARTKIQRPRASFQKAGRTGKEDRKYPGCPTSASLKYCGG
jgi:TDG/mug DNA glycosylase family protein